MTTDRDPYVQIAELIQGGHFTYPEEAGLAIQILVNALRADETPTMALAMAKNLDTGNAEIEHFEPAPDAWAWED